MEPSLVPKAGPLAPLTDPPEYGSTGQRFGQLDIVRTNDWPQRFAVFNHRPQFVHYRYVYETVDVGKKRPQYSDFAPQHLLLSLLLKRWNTLH